MMQMLPTFSVYELGNMNLGNSKQLCYLPLEKTAILAKIINLYNLLFVQFGSSNSRTSNSPSLCCHILKILSFSSDKKMFRIVALPVIAFVTDAISFLRHPSIVNYVTQNMSPYFPRTSYTFGKYSIAFAFVTVPSPAWPKMRHVLRYFPVFMGMLPEAVYDSMIKTLLMKKLRSNVRVHNSSCFCFVPRSRFFAEREGISILSLSERSAIPC